jgi:hypothetical protein
VSSTAHRVHFKFSLFGPFQLTINLLPQSRKLPPGLHEAFRSLSRLTAITEIWQRKFEMHPCAPLKNKLNKKSAIFKSK